MRVLKALFVLVLVALAGLAGWLYVAPPELIRVASDYSAKIVCSNAFLTGRDPQEVFEIDVRTHGHPLLKVMNVSVDREAGVVRAGLFGLFGRGLALHREGQGCATVPDGDLTAARAAPALPPPEPAEPGEGLWPAGETVEPSDNAALRAALDDPALTGPGMRAVVVVKDGRIVGERYGDGFDAETRLLGWSMTKTVTSAVIGTLIREGRLSLEDRNLFAGWKDRRADIALSDMLGMASDLAWDEEYGSISDVLRMLYLEPDMAGFASSKPLDEATPGGIGEVFNYSSGTSVMLSRVWQNTFDDPAQALAWPRESLFGPLGMRSAVFETDARGTFVGSSYLYATARDWARFGQFLLQRGVWEGRSLLPVGYVDWMAEVHPASGGSYGRGHVWRSQPKHYLPGPNADLPADAFHAQGHDGQTVSVIPSENLVVVRLGLTPNKLGYKPGHLMEAVIATLRD
jgi:CubicO group peptidase (beta-lactamase class C family)